MGIDTLGQVCVMIHSGSRGLGHQVCISTPNINTVFLLSPPHSHSPPQVATDALTAMEAAMSRDSIHVNDRQLACARIDSPEGRDYLSAMAAAANYAWVNRSSMTFLVRQAFGKVFGQAPDDLDMNVVYDVSHNIAKVHACLHTRTRARTHTNLVCCNPQCCEGRGTFGWGLSQETAGV